MSMCSKLNNLYFINKLKNKIDQDVILFGQDGMSYYGKLTEVDENNIAVLHPATLSSTNLVEIQNPAEVAAVENQAIIDLCYTVGFGYKIEADPFVLPNDDAEDVPEPASPSQVESDECECNHDALIDKLEDLQPLVTIATLGGFLIAGELISVKQNTAKLKTEYIFAPGGDGSTLFSINRVLVNLEAATAVAS